MPENAAALDDTDRKYLDLAIEQAQTGWDEGGVPPARSSCGTVPTATRCSPSGAIGACSRAA